MNLGADIGLKMGKATRDAFGEALREAGKTNENIVVVDGDVNNSTRTEWFKEAFPERFFNVGIAESNLISVA
ncbi:MAG TPA: transketolase family protein, partial [Nitrolancea sp.]|nr:transketolase family protein [Nitrolancea sp.]